jgi:hypothetical protein
MQASCGESLRGFQTHIRIHAARPYASCSPRIRRVIIFASWQATIPTRGAISPGPWLRGRDAVATEVEVTRHSARLDEGSNCGSPPCPRRRPASCRAAAQARALTSSVLFSGTSKASQMMSSLANSALTFLVADFRGVDSDPRQKGLIWGEIGLQRPRSCIRRRL